MSQMLYSSDFHLGHKAINKYRGDFSSAKDHDDYIIDKILQLPKRTVLTILGDFLFDGEHYDEYIERLSKKRCRIKLVMGNHDSRKLYTEKDLHVELQLPLYSYKNCWVSHMPIHTEEFRKRKLNIHGHLHKEVVMKDAIKSKFGGIIQENIRVPDKRYYNVNIDVNNYEFVSWEKIKESIIC